MTNLEFLQHASAEAIARFLLTNDDEEPEDWDEEMKECIHWLHDKFDEHSLIKYLKR